MGISGLLPFLQKSSRRAHIKEFSGATVAIDAYCWLHKGAFSCAEKLVMNEPTTMYVAYCMKYVSMLLSFNIKPILVFDGQNLPAKNLTEVKRRQSRDVNRRKGLDLIRAGRVAEGRNVLRRSLDVSHDMALEVIKECRRRNVDCIVAPYEADAQLAYLSTQGIAHVIITEDSDLMLFGCKTVMFKMDINGNGVVVESWKLHLSMGVREDLFTLEKFRLMCILSGCDYLDSLPGIGLSKACKFVTRCSESNIYQALEKLPANLNMWTLEVTDEYRQGVVDADLTFRCQLVYDPVKRKQVPLSTPRVGEEAVGAMKDPATALQLALGNLNPRDLTRMDNFNPDTALRKARSKIEEAIRAPHRSIWAENYVRSAQPKMQPTIMRFATSGKTINTSFQLPPPAVKRDAEDEENAPMEEEDLMKLYGESKKPKTLPLDEPLECSRYFTPGFQQKPAVLLNFETENKKTPFLDQLDQSPLEENGDTSSLEDKNRLAENDRYREELSISSSPVLPYPIKEENNLSNEIDLFAEQELSSSPCLESSRLSSIALLEGMENITTADSTNASSESCNGHSAEPEETLSPSLLSSTRNVNSKPFLRAFQFRTSEPSAPRTNILSSLDTVGTAKSVFFSGFTQSSPKITEVTPRKLRTGLSRKKPAPNPQQSALTKFGFLVRPKMQGNNGLTKSPTARA